MPKDWQVGCPVAIAMVIVVVSVVRLWISEPVRGREDVVPETPVAVELQCQCFCPGDPYARY